MLRRVLILTSVVGLLLLVSIWFLSGVYTWFPTFDSRVFKPTLKLAVLDDRWIRSPCVPGDIASFIMSSYKLYI
ncbi:hypothetical protein V1522DRAFT_396824 [Lipomyces starkeyi]